MHQNGRHALRFSDTLSTMRRTKVQMEELDGRIRPLYLRGLGCRVIGRSLGESPVTIFRRVRAMGISRGIEEAKPVVAEMRLPFASPRSATNLRSAALGIAMGWFAERGYVVSIPTAPTTYDLIVDSDEGLKKVQVKSCSTRKNRNGRSTVGIAHLKYSTERRSNSGGKRAVAAYERGELDIFFIVTESSGNFLIPLDLVIGRKCLVLDEKYAKYKI